MAEVEKGKNYKWGGDLTEGVKSEQTLGGGEGGR